MHVSVDVVCMMGICEKDRHTKQYGRSDGVVTIAFDVEIT